MPLWRTQIEGGRREERENGEAQLKARNYANAKKEGRGRKRSLASSLLIFFQAKESKRNEAK